MLLALSHTHPRLTLILKRPESEGEASSLLGDLREGRARSLHLEEVRRGRLLVDSRPGRVSLGLIVYPSSVNGGTLWEVRTYSGLLRVADEDVKTVDLSLVERVGVVAIPPLLFRWERNDTLLRLNRVALMLTAPISRQSIALVLSSLISYEIQGRGTGEERTW